LLDGAVYVDLKREHIPGAEARFFEGPECPG
jgi:hypothetical protein